MMGMRDGAKHSLAAVLLAGATVAFIVATTSDQRQLVVRIGAVGIVWFVVMLILGARRLLGVATVPVLAGALVETLVNDESTWVRSLAVGCLWYVTVEVGWEAIALRDGRRQTQRASMQRVHEVVTVVGLAFVIGLVAMVASGLAPTRTLPIQLVVIVGFIAILISTVRRLAPPNETGA